MLLPLLGIAPAAEMYAVKVFPASAAGVPSSVIEQALDHVITQKTSGALDIDVINMSLGGASIADGKSLEEQLVDAATAADMTVVIASGNEGPAPNSIARPGTANTALAVGGTTDEVHTRIFWDFNIASGAGATLYPTDELRIADFSNIGPIADGRVGVDVVATGVFNFSTFPTADPFGPLGWSSGTSFATPQGAGAAALLNAWAENNDPSIDPTQIQNAIKGGASPMDAEWTEFQQGAGFLNVPNALDLLQNGNVNRGGENSGNTLKPTVLKGNKSTVTETVTLERGRTASWVFEIDENTESVDIDIDLDGAVAPGPGAAFGFPNSFEFYVKSAKRGGAPYLIETLNFVDDAEATIGDGFINTSGFSAPDVDPEPAPMEPGLMKVIVEADWTNNVDELTATVTITRNQGPGSSNIGGYTGTLGNHESQVFVVDIPAGTTEAIFDLNWKHDWSKFPANDLDMLFVSPSSFPSFDFSFLDGASLNVPERQTIENPEAGTWFVIVDGFEVIHGKDPFKLDVTLIP